MTQVQITCSRGIPTALDLNLLCPLMSLCPEILDVLILALTEITLHMGKHVAKARK